MIRRNARCADGRDGWLLVSQVEHARLAADIFRHWRFSAAAGIGDVRDEIEQAIIHHDDGWLPWEAHPKVAGETGCPIDFTEMPLADSLDIWRRSIEISERIGGLAAYMVAGHFSYLLQHSATWTAEDASGELARQWHGEFTRARKDWLAAWLGLDHDHNSRHLADFAVKILQAFDAASLWFCCSDTNASHATEVEPEQAVVFTPEVGHQIHVRPWPFDSPDLELGVSGELVPVQRFEDSDCLRHASRVIEDLSWKLGPVPLK